MVSGRLRGLWWTVYFGGGWRTMDTTLVVLIFGWGSESVSSATTSGGRHTIYSTESAENTKSR